MTAEPAQPSPVHRRVIEFDAYDDGDDLRVVGRLRDLRPWLEDKPMSVLHDIELDVVVRKSDQQIVDARATMHSYPHTECPLIEPAFADLVGLSVARGYVSEVQRRFGGARGCSHIEQLARALGPAVIQAITSSRARAGQLMNTSGPVATSIAWLRNTCHVWAEDGYGETKLALGWRPKTDGPYPAPPVEEIRRAAEQP